MYTCICICYASFLNSNTKFKSLAFILGIEVLYLDNNLFRKRDFKNIIAVKEPVTQNCITFPQIPYSE